MKLLDLPVEQALGHILRHNLADHAGRKALAKGHRIEAADLPRLRELGLNQVRVAVLEPDDVHEDQAAAELGAAVAGTGIRVQPAAAGRVNLLASQSGPLQVAVATLRQINDLPGIAIATLPEHQLVRADKPVATIKIIPFAIAQPDLVTAVNAARQAGGLVRVQPLRLQRVGVLLVGSARARPRLERSLYPPIEARVAELGGSVVARCYLPYEAASVAAALQALQAQVELLIIAGETSIMDLDDATPGGIMMAGGMIEHHGAPVEPGNLLLLAYLDQLPILGAPGCVRSRSTNIVDLILPRLMAGERLSRADIIELGHGGFLV